RTPDGRLVVVTGPMNTGKSTLVAALVACGCDYLGDESIGISRSDLHAWGYPKPLTLDPTSQRLAGIDPVGEPLTSGEHRRPQEIGAAAKSLTGNVGKVDLVVHTAYRPQSPPESRRLHPAQAIELLLTNTLNLLRSGRDGFETLCRVAEGVPVVSVVHGDTLELAERIVATGADPDRLTTEPMRSRVGASSETEPWWRDWEGVRATLREGLGVYPLGGAAHAVAVLPTYRSLVLDAPQAAICSAAKDHATLGVGDERLSEVDERDETARRVALIESAQQLQRAGIVTLDRTPDESPPIVESPDGPSSAIRRPLTTATTSLQGLRASAGFAFEPGRRSGESWIGTLSLAGPVGLVTVGVLSDVDLVREWLESLPPEVFAATDGPGTDFSLRVLGLPGSDHQSLLVVTPSATWGPLAPEDAPVAICRAVTQLVGIEPPDGRWLGRVWMTEHRSGWRVSPFAPNSGAGGSVAEDEAWISDDAGSVWVFDAITAVERLGELGAATFIEPSDELWCRRPLDRIDIDEVVDDDASLVAACVDLLRRDLDEDLKAGVDLAIRLVEADKIEGRPTQSASTDPPDTPPAIAALGDYGTLGARGRSLKLSGGKVAERRMTWPWSVAQQTASAQRAGVVLAMGDFATGTEAAAIIINLEDHDGRFVVGVDQNDDGTTSRHKLYVEVTELATWTALVTAFPTVGELHDASVLSSAGAVTTPPRFVAWKRVGPQNRTILSVYRRQHRSGATVRDAVRAVLADGSEWFDPVSTLIAPDRDLAAPLQVHDLEVIEQGGRHSIDLQISNPTPRGERFAVAHWLAALAGVHGAEATSWANAVARQAHYRLIVGTGAGGEPFVSVYHA
ncbi:MAG TPA: hypothetical protein VFN21_04105, partial [Acidimicrobiales bacterium]|nr:hypothetical protein [Acidimicrobiales bacterium]